MTYKINDTDLKGLWGIIPSPFSGSTMAIKGALDFPKRDGKTEYDWGTETEVFCDADDIKWKGRDIIFKGFVQKTNRASLLSVIDQFSELCKSGPLSFETPLGTFSVILKSDIKIDEFLGHNAAYIEAKFYQETISFPGTTGIPSGGSGYLLDGFNLKTDFGIVIEDRQKNLDTPARIEVKTTGTFTGTQYRKPRDIKLKCKVIGDSISEIQTNLNQFYKLLSSPGMKLLTFPDTGYSHSVYVKDGIQLTNIINGSKAMAQFYFKVREPNP
jgi:hypothetical protein